MGSRVFPEMHINYALDRAFYLGGGLEFIPGVFSVGITGRRISRRGRSDNLGVETMMSLDIEEFQKEINHQYTGYGLDMGANLKLPFLEYHPQLALAWRNIGDTRISTKNEESSLLIHQKIHMGASVQFETRPIPLLAVVEYKDILNENNLPITHHLHIGLEGRWKSFLLRTGLYQGYTSLGFGLVFPLFRLEFSTYAAELGAHAGQHKDRRYLFSLRMGLDVDPGTWLNKHDHSLNKKISKYDVKV